MEWSLTVPDYQQDLTSCMYQLQQNAVLCDAGLECKDGVIYVHKLVLISCGSPYLKQHVLTGNSTTSKCYVSLSEFSLKTVCCLVQTLYTGELRIFHENLKEFINLCIFIGVGKVLSVVQMLPSKEQSSARLDLEENTGDDEHEDIQTCEDSSDPNSMVDRTSKIKNDDHSYLTISESDNKSLNQMSDNDQNSCENSATETSGNQSLKRSKSPEPQMSTKKAKSIERTEDDNDDEDDSLSDTKIKKDVKANSDVEKMFIIAKQLSTDEDENEKLSKSTSGQVDSSCQLCKKVFMSKVKKDGGIDPVVCESCENLYSGKDQEHMTDEEQIDGKTEKKNKPKRRRKVYDTPSYKQPDNMEAAYEAVVKDKMSIRGAGRKFGIPESTLRDRIKRKCVFRPTPGIGPVIDGEEAERFIKFSKLLLKRGYLCSRDDMCTVGSQYAISLGKRTRDRPLTKHWFYYFCNKYPEIKELRTHLQHLDKTQSVDPSQTESFFSYFVSTMTKQNLQDKPHLLFSITSSDVAYMPPYLINETNIHEEMDKITVFLCASGAGDVIEPFYVFPEATIQLEYLQDDCKPGVGFVADESLYECEVFLKYLQDHFLKYAPLNEHKILFVDGHKLFLSVSVMEWAEQNNITILIPPAQSSEELQPLEGECLQQFERIFTRMCKPSSHTSTIVDRSTLCKAVSVAYKQAFARENIQRAFQLSGIYPPKPEIELDGNVL